MTIQTRGMRHVLVPTDDLDATKRFYGDILGLTRMDEPETGFAFEMAWFERGGSEVHIVKRTEEVKDWTGTDFNPTMQPHVAFEVADYDEAREELRRQGYTFYEAHGEGVLSRKQLFVRDPNGFYIELYEIHPEGQLRASV
jgi:glyoxylase I family protein